MRGPEGEGRVFLVIPEVRGGSYEWCYWAGGFLGVVLRRKQGLLSDPREKGRVY